MFGISISHLLVVAVVIILVGPERAGKVIGNLMAELKKLRSHTRFDSSVDQTAKKPFDLKTLAEHKIGEGTKLRIGEAGGSVFDRLEKQRTLR